MASMLIEFETSGPVPRLVVHGEVDLSSRDQLREALDRALAVAEARRVDVDLSAVTFLDAAGIGALIAAHTAARSHGISLRVVGATGLVLQVLEITGTAGVLGIKSDPPPQPRVGEWMS